MTQPISLAAGTLAPDLVTRVLVRSSAVASHRQLPPATPRPPCPRPGLPLPQLSLPLGGAQAINPFRPRGDHITHASELVCGLASPMLPGTAWPPGTTWRLLRRAFACATIHGHAGLLHGAHRRAGRVQSGSLLACVQWCVNPNRGSARQSIWRIASGCGAARRTLMPTQQKAKLAGHYSSLKVCSPCCKRL